MKLLAVFLCTLAALVGCSKSPKNYNVAPVVNSPVSDQALPSYTDLSKAPAMINFNGSSKPSTTFIEGLGGDALVGGSEFDAKVKFNSSQPIIYDVGMAGIDASTTLDVANTILAPPRSPPDINGDALYDEGLLIRWRRDEPRTPVFFLILGSYLGKIEMPPPMQPIGMNHDFSTQYVPNSRQEAERMARDYYRIFEQAPADFDCLPVGLCSVDWGPDEQKNFIVILPGLTMLMSKDRFVMFRLMMIPQFPLGVLNNNLDIVKGQFLVPGEAPIALGDSFESVEQRWQASVGDSGKQPPTSVNTSFFGRNYSGGYLAYAKTRFERTDVQPLATDRLKSLQVWQEYNSLLTLQGQPILITESATGVDLRVATQADTERLSLAELLAGLTNPTGEREVAFQVNMGLRRQNVKSFAEKLQTLLETEFAKAYPQAQVSSHLTGAFQNKRIKSYTVFVAVFDASANDGLFAQFTVDEERGNLSGVYMTKLGGEAFRPFEGLDTFDKLVMPEMNTPVAKSANKANFTELSGLQIGQQISVKDWDLGRNEATVALVGQNIQERASYYDRSTEFLAFSTEKATRREMAFVYISSLNVSLGLTLVKEENGERLYRITLVRSALKLRTIDGLCGGALKAEIGMSEQAFTQAISAIPNCPYFIEKETTGSGRLTRVHFPEDFIRLSFSDLEVTMATVYSPAGGAN